MKEVAKIFLCCAEGHLFVCICAEKYVYLFCDVSIYILLTCSSQIRMDSPALGKNSEERTESVGKIMNEANIIKEQVQSPSSASSLD